MTSPAPPQDNPASEWYGITKVQFGNPDGWRMAMAASEAADEIMAAVTAHGGTVADDLKIRIRIGATVYHRLVAQDESTRPPGAVAAPTCTLDRADIRDWLTHRPDTGRRTMAERLHLDDTVHAASDTLAARLPRLVAEAQQAGVFGIPDHQIRLWHVSNPDLYADGYMVTVQPPYGPQLAHGDLSAEELIGPYARGVEAALDVLTTIGQRVNTMLTEQARATANPSATAGNDITPVAPRSSAHRAFGAPLTQSTAGPAAAVTTDSTGTPPRPRGR